VARRALSARQSWNDVVVVVRRWRARRTACSSDRGQWRSGQSQREQDVVVLTASRSRWDSSRWPSGDERQAQQLPRPQVRSSPTCVLQNAASAASTAKSCSRRSSAKGDRVVAGSRASTNQGQITTLGRAARNHRGGAWPLTMKADACEIVTDGDGSTPPRSKFFCARAPTSWTHQLRRDAGAGLAGREGGCTIRSVEVRR